VIARVDDVAAALAELAELGATADGIDRPLFTAPEHAARERFAAWARACGARVEQDRAGNLFARREGRDPVRAPIQCGSHLDTVKGGGAYDGAFGVVAGLAVLARFARDDTPTQSPIEVVAWAGEEGSRFPVGTLGSSVYAGITPYERAAELQAADDGERFADAFDGPHGALRGVPIREGAQHPAAYAELHVEQGPILEGAGARLGIVTGIAGQRRFVVRLRGVAGHAGTVPMDERSDALAAAAEIVLRLERLALGAGECVATVGTIAVEPNQANVIPGSATLRAEVRAPRDATLERVAGEFGAACRQIGARRGVAVTVEESERRDAVAMDPALTAIVGDVCRALDARARPIVSGAGHDAMCVARVAPAGMIFVPSAGGRSHVADEHTERADLELGVRALAETLLAFDRHLTGR